MLLRLADRQGIFNGPGISRFQQWALAWLIVEDRKEHFDEIYDQQDFFFSLIAPELYKQVVSSKPDQSLADGEMHITPDDFSMVDKWLAELDKPKTTSLEG